MADLILKVTSEEVRNKAQEISTQRELLEGYMQEMQNQVTSLESSWEADSGSKYMEVYQNVSNNIKKSLDTLQKMYERIQYSTEEIREVIQTLRRIYDNAEKNLKEWTQIKALLQECSFSKENKEILQRVEKQCNIIKTEMEALIYKLYRVNAVYEKVEQKNKKLIQKIQNNQTGKGYKISLRSSHLLKEWNGKICIRLECGESFIVEDWLIDFLAQR